MRVWHGWGLVPLAEEQVADVVGHFEVACAIVVTGGIIPRNVDAGKLFAFTVLKHFVVLIEDAKEVVGVLASNIFDAEIIDD